MTKKDITFLINLEPSVLFHTKVYVGLSLYVLIN